jgi:hypothetical protein
MTRYGIVAQQLAEILAQDLLTRLQASAVMPLLALTKRAAFFLAELLAAGREGITTIGYPGVRVGDAIHKLRKAGVSIETQHEAHERLPRLRWPLHPAVQGPDRTGRRLSTNWNDRGGRGTDISGAVGV